MFHDLPDAHVRLIDAYAVLALSECQRVHRWPVFSIRTVYGTHHSVSCPNGSSNSSYGREIGLVNNYYEDLAAEGKISEAGAGERA